MAMISRMETGDRFERQLKELLEASGWRVEPAPDPAAFDVLVSKGDLRYAVEIKYAKEARRALVEGLLASAILRARVAASEVNAKPLAIVCAPSVSAGLMDALRQFMRRYGEGAAWGAMDDLGLMVLDGPGLERVQRERRHLQRRRVAQHRTDFLSDLGQWMLKVLFSHRLPPELRLRSPVGHDRIDAPIASTMTLAKVAGVSAPTASRFVSSMKEARFLVQDAALGFIRGAELLEDWRFASKRRPPEIRARWLFSPRDPSKHLDDVLRQHARRPRARACLGLFAACDRLGFRFVSGVAPHVYLEHSSADELQRLGLRLAEPGESADVFVREPRFPESVFRGSLERDGVPVTDVLQCWIDVSDHPARGEEMADHLFDRIIRPTLLEDHR